MEIAFVVLYMLHVKGGSILMPKPRDARKFEVKMNKREQFLHQNSLACQRGSTDWCEMLGMQILRKHFLLLLSSSQSNWIVVFGLLEQKKSWFLHSFVVVVETQKVRRDVVHLRQTNEGKKLP